MPDHEHVQVHTTRAREACLNMKSAIIDLLPGANDEFVRASLLQELALIQQELKFLSYSAMEWSS